MSEDPQDERVERAIKRERDYMDPYKNSIDPPGLEGSGLGKKDEEYLEFAKGEEKADPEKPVGRSNFEKLSSDSEEDTTEGEITDTDESA